MKKKNSKKANAKQQQPRAVASKANASAGTVVSGAKQANIVSRPDGSTIVAHTEFVCDVSTSTSARASYIQRLNPQRATIFTWLSAIASRYEMYRFRSLKFHYKPSCSTQTTGYVVLGFDFDALDYMDGDPPSKPEMLAWKYSVKSSPWQPCNLDVSADSRLSTFRYCDQTDRITGDPRLDALGTLVMMPSSTSAQFVGELFVSYIVEFRQPSYKLPPALYAERATTSFVTDFRDWFGSSEALFLQNFAGNLAVKYIDKYTLQIGDIGKLLVTSVASGTTGVNNSPTVTLALPSSSPSASATLTQVFNTNNGTTQAVSEYYLDITVPPVNLVWSSVNGTSITGQVMFATFKNLI